jgi:hypothetical protein
MDEDGTFYKLGNSDFWYDSPNSVEDDILDEADNSLDLGIRGEWREWGDWNEDDVEY